jgi:hypothetical protein
MIFSRLPLSADFCTANHGPTLAYSPVARGDRPKPSLALRVQATRTTAGGSRARKLLAGAWAAVAPAAVRLPAESLRYGSGPRRGAVASDGDGRLWWSTSIAHSAAGPVVAAAVVVQPIDRCRDGLGITVGVDVEPVNRFVHPGVARLLAARADREAAIVANGTVPLLVVVCAKEAAFKADPSQRGRVLSDYAWITAEAEGASGWCGVAIAGEDPRQHFFIRVIRVYDHWVAIAFGEW